MNMIYEALVAKIAKSIKLGKEECQVCTSEGIPYPGTLPVVWQYSCQAMLNRWS